MFLTVCLDQNYTVLAVFSLDKHDLSGPGSTETRSFWQQEWTTGKVKFTQRTSLGNDGGLCPNHQCPNDLNYQIIKMAKKIRVSEEFFQEKPFILGQIKLGLLYVLRKCACLPVFLNQFRLVASAADVLKISNKRLYGFRW